MVWVGYGEGSNNIVGETWIWNIIKSRTGMQSMRVESEKCWVGWVSEG